MGHLWTTHARPLFKDTIPLMVLADHTLPRNLTQLPRLAFALPPSMSLPLAVSGMGGFWALGCPPHKLGEPSPCKLGEGQPCKLGGTLLLQPGGVAPAAATASIDVFSVDAASNALLDVSLVDKLDPMSIHPPGRHSNSNPKTEPTTSNHTNKAPEPAPMDPSQVHLVIAHTGTSKSVARTSRTPTLSPSSADIAQADRDFPIPVSPSGVSTNPNATLANPVLLALILGELHSFNARFLCLEQELSHLHHLCHDVCMLGWHLEEDMPLL
jgi:hypothetical protein